MIWQIKRMRAIVVGNKPLPQKNACVVSDVENVKTKHELLAEPNQMTAAIKWEF